MPDNVELRANFTADSTQLTEALERSKTQIQAVKKASEQTTGGLGKMAEASKQSALGADGLSGGMSKLQQALGKVSPEMANFTRLLDPKVFTGAAGSLGLIGTALGALTLVANQLGKAFKESLEAPSKQLDTILDRSQQMHSLMRDMDKSDASLLREIKTLDEKQNKTVEEKAKLEALVNRGIRRGFNLSMSTEGKVYGVDEAIEQQTANAYTKEVMQNEAALRAERMKEEEQQRQLNLKNKLLSKIPVGLLTKVAPALGLEASDVDVGLNMIEGLLGVDENKEKIAASQAAQQRLQNEQTRLTRDNPIELMNDERAAKARWQQQEDARREEEIREEEEKEAEARHAALTARRLKRWVNGAPDAPGWVGTTMGVDQLNQIIHLLEQANQNTLRVAKEE